MGVPSTVRRPPSGARQKAGTLMLLASCPVEDCPVGGCLRRIPPSTSNRSLRCGTDVRLTIVNPRLQPVNRPLPRSARRNCSDLPLSRLIQVGAGSPIDVSQSTQIPVHGYDIALAFEDVPDRLPRGSDLAATGPERPVLGHFPKGNSRLQPVNQTLPRSTRNYGCYLPLFRLFQVQNSPRLPSWELTLILVHGYDTTSGLSQSGVLVRGARGRAPLTDHDISPSNSSDSMEDRPPHRGGGGSRRWSRRGERREHGRTAAERAA